METLPDKPHSQKLRTGRVSLPQQIYLVTMVTQARVKIFADYDAAALAARNLYSPVITSRAETLAFVVMPDHLHWLLQLGETAALSDTVRRYKAAVSLQLQARIWQAGFHDHALRSEESLRDVARYVIANPLRAGLCQKIGDYPFWNAVWL
jgi:REP element-mobilizing transposase RayT